MTNLPLLVISYFIFSPCHKLINTPRVSIVISPTNEWVNLFNSLDIIEMIFMAYKEKCGGKRY